MMRCCLWCAVAAVVGYVLGLVLVAATLIFGPDLDRLVP